MQQAIRRSIMRRPWSRRELPSHLKRTQAQRQQRAAGTQLPTRELSLWTLRQ